MKVLLPPLLLASLLYCSCFGQSSANLLIGAGKYDITGPAAEVNMMGYASLEQNTAGIHFRQWSRAFIFADSQTQKRVVYVSIDAQSCSLIIKLEVVKRLEVLYGSLYTEKNVMISGTHTHSGPAGYFQYLLYQITSLGFVQETFQPIVNGIVQSIKKAHDSLQEGSLLANVGELTDASINRSPTAYLLNPPEERARYSSDVDQDMTVLKMLGANGEDIGMISWFAVHPVSMNRSNQLISGDNKGVASYLMEQEMSSPGTLPGNENFVAAFAQSNEGDVSPNINGPRCLDTGMPCDMSTSTCNGQARLCVASGPGNNMFESTTIIGERQFQAGKVIYDGASKSVSGSVDYRHIYVNMSKVTVDVDGQQVTTCPAALGFSFAAGPIDGPTDLDFTQGDLDGDPLWKLVRGFISTPTEQQKQCHAPKPILLNTGALHLPYDWVASVLPLQLLRIGKVVIAGVPAEFTTMSGRRLRESIKQVLVTHGYPNDTMVVISGLTNAYSHYATTFEEYQHQRYEGASTAYGPHTLAAYIKKFGQLAKKLATGRSINPGPTPENLLNKQISLLPPVFYDGIPIGQRYGSVYTQPDSEYSTGSTVNVEFWSGHPRNNLQTGSTFLTVEKENNDGTWEVVHNDNSLETRFEWDRINVLLGFSRVSIRWDIPSGTPPGTYRINHYGHRKQFFTGIIEPYSGTTQVFSVVSA